MKSLLIVCFCLLACKATSGAGRSVCSLSVPAFITSVPPSHFGTIKTGIRSLGKGRFPLHGFQGNKLAQTGQRRAGLTRIAASVNDQDVDNMTVKEMRNELNSRGVYHQDCFEKSELRARLQEFRASSSTSAAQVASPVKDRSPTASSSTDQSPDPSSSESTVKAATQLFSQIELAQGAFKVALSRHRAQDGTLGSQTKIDEEYCYSMPIRFSNLGVDSSFIIDTAAGMTIITPSFAASCGAKETGATAVVSGGTTLSTNLKQVDLGLAAVLGDDNKYKELQCGYMKPIVMELPVNEVGGILGLDLLTRLGLCAFSFKTNSALLFQEKSHKAEVCNILTSGGLKEVPLFFLPPPTGLHFIKVRLSRLDQQSDGPTLTAIIDTGSPFSIMNWAALRDLGLSESSSQVRKTTQVVSGVGSPGQDYSTLPVSEVDLKLKVGGVPGTGAFSAGTHKFCVADLASFVANGFKDKPVMILGLDVLAGQLSGGRLKPEYQCLAFDIGQKRLWMTPAYTPQW